MEMASQFGTHFLPKRTVNNLRDVKDYTITLNTLLRKARNVQAFIPFTLIRTPTATSPCWKNLPLWINV